MSEWWILASVGALLAMDYTFVGQFMLSQPLVLGAVFGFILQDISTGISIGALVQLLWLGSIPVGAFIPAEHTVTGGITVALTEYFSRHHGISFPVASMVSLALAIPAGMISGILDVGIRKQIHDPLARWIEKNIDQGRKVPIGWIMVGTLLLSFGKVFFIYALWLCVSIHGLFSMVLGLPSVVITGLNLVYWALPALSTAVMIELFSRDRSLLVTALSLIGCLGLLAWFPQLWGWCFVALAILSLVYFGWPTRSSAS
jgi:mannose/fructose/N-acetylgalactosamine-specific phosphotransferase system component IIC